MPKRMNYQETVLNAVVREAELLKFVIQTVVGHTKPAHKQWNVMIKFTGNASRLVTGGVFLI